MHVDDEDEETGPISNYYGIWTGIIGLAIAGGLTWLMFLYADGFT